MAEGSRVSLQSVQESVYGTTPTAQLQKINFEEESFKYNRTKERSKRVLQTREYPSLVSKTQDVEGGFKTPLQAANTDSYLAKSLMGAWSDVIGGTGGGAITAGLTASNLDIEFTIEIGAGVGGIITFGSSVSAPSILLDQVIFANGTTTALNDGSYICTEVIDTHNFRVNAPLVNATYESLCIISGDVVRNGSTILSDTFERAHNDVSEFFQYLACVLASLEIKFEPEEEVMLDFAFMGKTETTSQATVSSSAPAAAPTGPDFVTGDNVDGIFIDYVALDDCEVEELTIKIDNKTEGRKSIAVFGPCAPRIKTLDVTGSITLFFDSITQYQKYKLDTEFQLAIIIGDSLGNKYAITLANTEFSTGEVNVSDREDETPEEHEFSCSTDGVFTIQICKHLV